MNRRAIIAGAVLIGVLVLAFAVWSHGAQAPESPVTPEATTTPAASDPESAAPQNVLVQANTTVVLRDTAIVQATAILLVDGVRYALTAPEGATLKEAMDRLKTEGSFTYTYEDYAGLGAFVTTINNRASTGDMVWILYVQGKKSGTGISSTRIRSGDVIEWKLEKSY